MGESQTIHGHDPLVGSMVGGRYRVKDLLGEGGMGQVYLAIHEAIEKPVALKILRPEYSRKADIVTRFQQEAISASRIKHPNVLDVFDFGQTVGGCFFLAMEFLEGHDLSDELERLGRLDSARAVSITLQIAKALAAAHGAGVVHRDLKPENVFLQRTADDEEVVKIVDFGIAQLRTNEEAAAASQKRQRRRLTRTGMIFGTPEYMAPEQAAGKHADLRVDVYALGVMMYEMFTGAVPFTGDTFMAVLSSHLHDPVPPLKQVCPELQISAELEALIARALAKKPEDRFASMQDLAGALRATPEGEGRRTSVLPTAAAVPLRIGGPAAAEGGLDAASAQTLVPDETSHVSPDARFETAGPVEIPKRSLVPALLGLGALVLAGGAGAVIWWAGPSIDETPTAPQPPPAPSTLAPEPSTVTRLETPPAPSASAATTIEPASGVRLEVETAPPGAEVFLDGAQVCDSSPCEIRADHNETVTITAKKGALTGTKKVLAQREQKVVIQLKPPPGPLPRPTAKPAVSDKLCTKYDDKLEMYVSVPCPR